MTVKKAPSLNILFLCDYSLRNAATMIDHCESFHKYSAHSYFYLNPLVGPKPAWLCMDNFDVIIIHYNISLLHLPEDWFEAIAHSRRYKVQFIQDEYRQINQYVARIRDVGIHALFTLAPENLIPRMYPADKLPGVSIHQTLAGYVPEYLERNNPDFNRARPIDVIYRARGKDHPWLGKLFYEKYLIGREFLNRAEDAGLCCDISGDEAKRLYGRDWVRFLYSGRCMLGTESGASVCDFTGIIENCVKEHLKKYPQETFETIQELYFKKEDERFIYNMISPRVFEAIACGCGLVMFPGEYSGILKRDVHYLVLDKDFSNFDEVVKKIKDTELIKSMAVRAHEDIIKSGRFAYRRFVEEFDSFLTEDFAKRGLVKNSTCRWVGLSRILSVCFMPVFKLLFKLVALFYGLLFQFRGKLRSLFYLVRSNVGGAQFRTFWKSLFLKQGFADKSNLKQPESSEPKRADFWDELCGTGAWKTLGLGAVTQQTLDFFDDWYFRYYFYIKNYLPVVSLQGKDVLEIGLGFGTVGQYLMRHARSYVGVDYAANPVRMMAQRIAFSQKQTIAKALQGDARRLSFSNNSFDWVISIGCFHHTGDIPACVRETYRVLREGGSALIMLYNRYSFRNVFQMPFRYLSRKFNGYDQDYAEYLRACFDSDSEGNVAPVTNFLSVRQMRKLFSNFREVKLYKQNLDALQIPHTKLTISREFLMKRFASQWGLDVYILAKK